MRSAGGANWTPRVCSKHTLNSFPPSWETLETLGLAANFSLALTLSPRGHADGGEAVRPNCALRHLYNL